MLAARGKLIQAAHRWRSALFQIGNRAFTSSMTYTGTPQTPRPDARRHTHPDREFAQMQVAHPVYGHAADQRKFARARRGCARLDPMSGT